MKSVYDQDFFFPNHPNSSIDCAIYDHCTFYHFDFSSYDFKDFAFIDCSFINCNFSLVTFKNTGFQQTSFNNCKLIGANFEEINPFALSFNFLGCDLTDAVFWGLDITSTTFKTCNLSYVLFEDAILKSVIFNDCNLSYALFLNTNLEQSDFTTAYGYTIDLSKNKVKNAQFSTPGLPGLLSHFSIKIV